MSRLSFALTAALCGILPLSSSAKIVLGTPFTDGVVLQRDMNVPVWGRAEPGRTVTVSFAGQEKSTSADSLTGRWEVGLDPLTASKESRTMTVTEGRGTWLFGSATDAVEVRDVLVGEVWFASGQSNMDCPIRYDKDTRYRDGNGPLVTEITRLPCVRYFKSPWKWSLEPCRIEVRWNRMVPENLRTNGFVSAVGYYYARELHHALDVPIGLVDCSWGGTNIDAWTPRSGYAGCDASIASVAAYVPKADWSVERDKKYPITWNNQQPTVLFNGMVAAFAPMATRGFIWYQGCFNEGEADLYLAKLRALYRGWSTEFRNPALRLYLVQLAPWHYNWGGVSKAQQAFVAENPNAALAVTADVGNFHDVHPNNKEIVARRLAVHALKRDYGFDIPEDCSPTFRAVHFDGARAILDFDHVENWYVYSPDRSRDAAFELAGADGQWKPAKILNYRKTTDKAGASIDTDFIDGPQIVLRAEDVPEPVMVRYALRPLTMGTLYNQAALPLGQFASDCAKTK